MVTRVISHLRMHNTRLTAACIGVVYFWFGFLKFIPGSSPAEQLAKDTIGVMTFGLIPPDYSYLLLAIWETALGLLFILNVRRKWVIYLALAHIVCTFTPLIFFPETSFQSGGSLTLTGQYIIKNLIIIAALLSIFPTEAEK